MSPHGSSMPQQLDGGSSTEKIQCVLSNFITNVNIQSVEIVQWGPVAPRAGLAIGRSVSVRVYTHMHRICSECFPLLTAPAGLSFWVLLASCFLPAGDR